MKKLTLKEVRNILSQYNSQGYVAEWKAFTDEYYGPKAYTVKVYADSHYNDDGYNTGIDHIQVFDKEGNQLNPDITLPVYAEEIKEEREKHIRQFKKQFPMLDESAWQKMADAEVSKGATDVVRRTQSDALYDLDWPDAGCEVGSGWHETYEFTVGKPLMSEPVFYIED